MSQQLPRKQCASCHIGRTRKEHRHDVMWDRGGGCLACHVSDYPEDAHPAIHEQDENHERLACASCHSQWAPQCFGCHMEYDPDGAQWDHIERALTPGRWSNERWHVNNVLPALGVNTDDEIEVFVPGMIMTVAHPDFEAEKFVRMFAPLSPHTTGKSRSCESCHRSSRLKWELFRTQPFLVKAANSR